MKKITIHCILCIAVLLVGCSREDSPMAPAETTSLDLELIAGEMVLTAGWDFDQEVQLPSSLASLMDKYRRCFIRRFHREVLVDDIVHYSLVLSVGPGEHDQIGLHRVVRESRPRRPIRTSRNLFLVHGMGKGFVGNFLPGAKSPLLPDDLGFAVFMAQNDVDVWGIDSRYTLVPAGLGDLSFAADWGMDTSVDDILTGVDVARFVRLFTGSGFAKMSLLGYSQGATMGYGVVNKEAQRPSFFRSVGAFVPVDWGLDFDDPEIAAAECEGLAGYQGLLDEGVYGFYEDPDGFLTEMGILARDYPGGPSPLFEGFTNLEVLLYYSVLATPPNTAHWWASSFDEWDFPVAFTYTTLEEAAEFWILWEAMSPPTQLWVDFHAILCGDSDTMWEDHLGAVALPVFSLQAAGGSGPGMASTLDRLSSASVAQYVVQLQAPEDVLLDFGHVDLFTAENAEAEAWQPTLDWLVGVGQREGAYLPEFENVLSQESVEGLNALEITMPETGEAAVTAYSSFRQTGGGGRVEPEWSVRRGRGAPVR